MSNNPGIADVRAYLADLVSMTKASGCTRESHEALKLDSVAWGTMDYCGIQEACEEYDLELRNCKCGSTLCKRIPKAA